MTLLLLAETDVIIVTDIWFAYKKIYRCRSEEFK